jgi:hypothetical protein
MAYQIRNVQQRTAKVNKFVKNVALGIAENHLAGNAQISVKPCAPKTTAVGGNANLNKLIFVILTF